MRTIHRCGAAFLLACLIGETPALPRSATPACPDLSSLQPSPVIESPTTPEQNSADKLVAEVQAVTELPAGDAGGIAVLAYANANASQQGKARELLGELLARDARGEHVVEYRIAAVYEALGERDQALEWLDKEIEDSSGVGSWLLWLNQDPVWTAMRSDPRYKQIQQRAGWSPTP